MKKCITNLKSVLNAYYKFEKCITKVYKSIWTLKLMKNLFKNYLKEVKGGGAK